MAREDSARREGRGTTNGGKDARVYPEPRRAKLLGYGACLYGLKSCAMLGGVTPQASAVNAATIRGPFWRT